MSLHAAMSVHGFRIGRQKTPAQRDLLATGPLQWIDAAPRGHYRNLLGPNALGGSNSMLVGTVGLCQALAHPSDGD